MGGVDADTIIRYMMDVYRWSGSGARELFLSELSTEALLKHLHERLEESKDKVLLLDQQEQWSSYSTGKHQSS